jgi:hypothetical protein
MIIVKSLGLAEANLLIQAGIVRANALGSPSTIVVVDVGGTVVAQARMRRRQRPIFSKRDFRVPEDDKYRARPSRDDASNESS